MLCRLFHLVLATLIWLGRSSRAQDPVRPYPLPDAFLKSTSILNHSSYVAGFDEPQWYLDNIPFVDFPDAMIQDIYYYRQTVLKRHLVYTDQSHGWIFSEFIQPVPWASKFLTIPDSAAHQIVEARWLRDPSYVKDTVQTYTRGGCEKLSGISYTHYIIDAVLEAAEVFGDIGFLTSQLDGMIFMYNLWNVTQDKTTGLYHRTPLLDAQEYSLPGWINGGPNGGAITTWNSFANNYTLLRNGPETYRPNFNAYMVAGARAISTVAALSGNYSLAVEWNTTANTLYARMQKMLWSHDIQFWIDVVQATNQDVIGRQLIGLYLYRFGIGTEDIYIPGLERALASDVFLTEYGPTTLEKSNPYFEAFKNTTYCCLWNGQSWPFSTCVYLGTLARLARENRSSIATLDYFNQAFSTYTRTHYLNGEPFVAEVHYPTIDHWSGYTSNHSEHYLHSTYIDNVFTNLLGIIPSLNDTFTMFPLVPSNWTYFAVENLPYHGTLLSILYDADGSHYTSVSHSAGLSIFSNGSLIHTQSDLGHLSITLPPMTNSSAAYLASQPRWVNILANPNAPHNLPYANGTDIFAVAGNNLGPALDAFKTIDGLLWYDLLPDNFYSNNQTGDPASWLNVTIPRPRRFSSLTLAVVDDSSAITPQTAGGNGGSLKCPAAVYVMVSNRTQGMGVSASTDSGGREIMAARRDPWDSCIPNARNTIRFDAGEVVADTISLWLVNSVYYAVGIAELEVWVPDDHLPSASGGTAARYEAEDGLIGFHVTGTDIGQNGSQGIDHSGKSGVTLGHGGMLEWGDVRTPDQTAATVNLTMLADVRGGAGASPGQMVLGVNWIKNITVHVLGAADGGSSNASVSVDLLAGSNVVTLFNTGDPAIFIDAIIVG